MPHRGRYLIAPAVLLAFGAAAVAVRTADRHVERETREKSRSGTSNESSSEARTGFPGDMGLGGMRVPVHEDGAIVHEVAEGSRPAANAGNAKHWPIHRKSKAGEPCASCDVPNAVSTENTVNRQGLLPANRPSGPQAAAQQTATPPGVVPASLETRSGSGVVIRDAVDMGFAYEPTAWHDGLLEIDNRSGKDVLVSLHGQGAAHAEIDGQPVEEGRQYVVRGAAQIRGSSDVGVHVRTRGVGTETAPNGDG